MNTDTVSLPGAVPTRSVPRTRVRNRQDKRDPRLPIAAILRDCRQHGDGLHHAVQAVAHMHNLALTSSPEDCGRGRGL